jgi:hypothetical protein
VPCAPTRILRDVIDLMRPRATEKGVPLLLELDGPIPDRLVSDPVRLRQILLNLVGNAVKFTAAGQVRVRARYEASARMLEFEVEDSGIGIAEGMLEGIFEPFRQGDSSMTRRFGGTGLGLAITRRLVERLGGAITVTSEVGSGSLFRVRVPAHPMESGGVSELPDSDTPSTGRMRSALAALRASGRILVVEDGPDNQRVIRHVLESAGYDVTTADNGLVGVELALAAVEEGTPFRVILMDVQMPVLTATKPHAACARAATPDRSSRSPRTHFRPSDSAASRLAATPSRRSPSSACCCSGRSHCTSRNRPRSSSVRLWSCRTGCYPGAHEPARS